MISRRVPDLSNMTTLFGRYFQVRDDYQNLMSAEVQFSNPIAIELKTNNVAFDFLVYQPKRIL